METRTVSASMEYWAQVAACLEAVFQREGCPAEERRLIEISAEELFTNIASYAYGPQGGDVQVECGLCPAEGGGRELFVRFRDRGTPYNPFSRPDPDLTLPIEERPIGGLGIYMVKQFMDGVEYSRRDGCNITTIRKRLPA